MNFSDRQDWRDPFRPHFLILMKKYKFEDENILEK